MRVKYVIIAILYGKLSSNIIRVILLIESACCIEVYCCCRNCCYDLSLNKLVVLGGRFIRDFNHYISLVLARPLSGSTFLLPRSVVVGEREELH